jgi:hypothetical protein
MTDDELVRWLETGVVVQIDDVARWPLGTDMALETWPKYDPCQARDSRDCLYCPWERCFRPRAGKETGGDVPPAA